MFKLKYSASTPSLLAATTSSPSPRRHQAGRSPSSGVLSVLHEQRQQQQQQQQVHHRSGSPVATSRTRTTSLIPSSPRRPAPQITRSIACSPDIMTKKKQKSSKSPSKVVGEDAAAAEKSVLEDIERNEDRAEMSTSASRQSVMIVDEDEPEYDASFPSAHNVNVCVRMRPSNDPGNEGKMWSLDGERNQIIPTELHPTIAKRSNGLSSPAKKSSATTAGGSVFGASNTPQGSTDEAYDFRFDSLVLPSMSTEKMYKDNISPIIDAVVSGYNGTVFAYGQTGSGKTHTMSGTATEKGIIPQAVEETFDKVDKQSSQREFLLRVSYLEIYNETLKDLLAPYPSSSSCTDLSARPASPIKGGSSHVAGGSSDSSSSSSLRIVEAGGRVQIQGLREEIVTSAAEVLNLLEWGQQRRHQAATDWNERSSRSHCVFILTVESREQTMGKAFEGSNDDNDVRFSQLNLIDLAGSERAASEKERRKEGAFINKSLLTLGTVIAKLSEQCQAGNDESAHIPYRDSKLTRLLQTSLGGNARVAVVCALSPDKEHAVESLSTLRFGQRCKSIITKAKKGTIVNDKALIARYKKELDRLRGQLEQGGSTSTLLSPSDSSLKDLESRRTEAERDVQSMNEKREELKRQIEHLTRLILTGKNVAEETAQAEDSMMIGNGTLPPRRRLARMSDMGTSSPSKRQKLFDDCRFPLTPVRGSDENYAPGTPSPSKPFALESEVATLKKRLASVTAGRQASEDARTQETQLWRSRIMELEAANTEQEEELDEAEAAFKKLQGERDTLRQRVEEETEANRLLQLVAKSRSSGGQGESSEGELKKLLEKSQVDIDRLRKELQEEVGKQGERRREQQEKVDALEKELAEAKERAEKAEHHTSDRIRALEAELQSHQASPAPPPDEVRKLREELRAAVEDRDKARKELKEAYLAQGQEDAQRDFADLINGSEESEDGENMRTKLARRGKRVQELTEEVENLKKELQQAKESKSSNNKSSTTRSTPLPDDLRALMQKQLQTSEARSKALEDQIASLKGSTDPSSEYGSGGESEEIERLNAIITTQRSIMTDLEASVDAWKSRLRLQHDIITRLVEAAGGAASIPEALDAGLPPTPKSDGEGSGTSEVKQYRPAAAAPFSSLPTAANSASTATPYYGAHSYNRVPTQTTGLGLGSASPTKGVAWLATMPGVKPEALPLPNTLSSPSGRKIRRKTIEHEIQELKGSPRVKSTTDRLLTSKASTNSLRPLPTPGSPAKLRPSRDYYI